MTENLPKEVRLYDKETLPNLQRLFKLEETEAHLIVCYSLPYFSPVPTWEIVMRYQTMSRKENSVYFHYPWGKFYSYDYNFV